MKISRHLVLIMFTISLTQMLMCLGRHVVEHQNGVGLQSVKYAIIFDASSSRTNMEIYRVDVDSPPLDVADVHELDPSPSKVQPGIAKLTGNPTQVEGYLKPLLDSAMKLIPIENRQTTAISFLATAGMQLSSQAKSNARLVETLKR